MQKQSYSHLLWIAVLTLAVVFLPTARAYAYLDPTSGSFILQIIVAGVLGALVSIRIFWTQISARLFKKSGDESPDADE